MKALKGLSNEEYSQNITGRPNTAAGARKKRKTLETTKTSGTVSGPLSVTDILTFRM